MGITHSAICVKDVEWGIDKRGFKILAPFWAGIPVDVTQDAGGVPRCRRAAIRIPF